MDRWITRLSRQQHPDSVRTELTCAEWPDTLGRYVDTTARPGTSYAYRLTTYDRAGLTHPEAVTLTLALLDQGLAPSVEGLRLLADSAGRQISLRWQYPAKGVDRFLLYRQRGAGSYLAEYQYLPATTRQFVEQNLSHDTPYTYALLVLMADGRRSRLSPRLSVTLHPPRPDPATPPATAPAAPTAQPRTPR